MKYFNFLITKMVTVFVLEAENILIVNFEVVFQNLVSKMILCR